MQTKVVVLILSYNGKNLLDECINSYLINSYPYFEIILIDNGSTDNTKDWVENNYPQVFVLRTEKNLGYSGGFNYGMDYAFKQKNADYVLITNNDVKADSNVISKLVEVAETYPLIGFVTGKVFYYEKPNVLQTTGYELTNEKYWLFSHRGRQQDNKGQFDNIEELEFADDIFMLVSRKVFMATKGYDLEFQFQSEQFDWQIRAKKAGFKIFYTPHAMIWHKESMTIGKVSSFKMYYNVRNTYVLRLKYKDKQFIKQFSKWYFTNCFIKPFLKNLCKFHLSISYSIFRGYFSAVLWGLKNIKV